MTILAIETADRCFAWQAVPPASGAFSFERHCASVSPCLWFGRNVMLVCMVTVSDRCVIDADGEAGSWHRSERNAIIVEKGRDMPTSLR